MPLPIDKYRVLPNPWAHIDPRLGPNGRCLQALRNDFPHNRYIGAEIQQSPDKSRPGDRVVVGRRTAPGPQSPRFDVCVVYPRLDAALLSGEPEVVTAYPPDGHYYSDRLNDGSLIPADDATRRAVPTAKFKTLAEAKAAAVAKFDAEFGEGSWAELEKLLGMLSSDTPALSRKAAKQESNT